MNITIFYSSKRKTKSSTYNAAQQLIKKLPDTNDIYEFFLPDDMPHFCCGCYACINGHEEKCGGYEYLKPIIDALDKSDLIIFCSPVYVFHASGQIKTLLDHFGYRWIIHRPDFSMRKKQAVIITTAGGGGLKSAAKDIKDSMDYWGVARTHIISQAVWQYSWNDMPDRFKCKLMNKINYTAKKIIKQNKHLTMSVKVKVLYAFFGRLHLNGKMMSVDDEYWQKMQYK